MSFFSFIRYGLGSLVACTKLLKFSFSNFISLKKMILSQHHLKLMFYIKGYQFVKEKSSISHFMKKKIVFRVFLKIMKNGLRCLVALTPSNCLPTLLSGFLRSNTVGQLSNIFFGISQKRSIDNGVLYE